MKKPKFPESWLTEEGSYEPYEGKFSSAKNPLRISKIREFHIQKIVNGETIFVAHGDLEVAENRVYVFSREVYEEKRPELLWTNEFYGNAYVRAIAFAEYAVWDELEQTWYVFWTA